jgi:ADP-ribose pyrophosphatase YjhB (NUDIX family)
VRNIKTITILCSFLLNHSLYSYECDGIEYTKNSFGDVLLNIDNLNKDELSEKLKRFISCVNAQENNPVIKIDVPYEKSHFINAIESAGFELHACTPRFEFIIKNGVSVPAPFTAVSSAQVLVLDGDNVLVVEEKTRKGLLGFPAGMTEPSELVRTTAARKLKEEVGYTANIDRPKLFAIMNRVKFNRYGASSYVHYFTINKNEIDGELKIDDDKILRAFFVPLQDVAQKDSIEGLSNIAFMKDIASHLLNKCKNGGHKSYLDPRQTDRLKKGIANIDESDTMTIEFFNICQ